MPTAGTLYQPTSPALLLGTNAKHLQRPNAGKALAYTPASVSPPNASASTTSSVVPSLTSGSYARSSSSDNESFHSGGQSVDLIEMMTDRLGSAVNPTPLDQSLAKQAQTSGELNAKQRELAELQALAQRRLRGTRASLADGMKAARDVRKDLEWTQTRVNALNAKAANKYPLAYQKASAKIPSPNEC